MHSAQRPHYVTLPPRINAWLRARRWLPWVILIISLLITWRLWVVEEHNSALELQAEFDFRAQDALGSIEQRMKAYEQVLRGVAGLFTHDSHVTRKEFHGYFSRLHLDENYPGIQGLAYLQLVPQAGLTQHVATVRGDGLPEYSVWPEGRRDIYTPVIYIEPFSGRNLKAFGYDAYSHLARREAMERARDNDSAALSRKLMLVQENGQDAQAGAIMYMPIYRNGAPNNTTAERRANIIGWVAAPFRMDDLMSGLLGKQSAYLDFEIYDGNTMSEQTLMHDSDYNHGSRGQAQFQSTRPISIAGRNWLVATRSHSNFEKQAGNRKPSVIAYTGISISLLLAWLTWALVGSRARALEAASDMNRDLIERETRYRQMFDDAPSIAFLVNPDSGAIEDANAAATAFWGYTREELRGMNITGINTAPLEEIHTAMSRIISGQIQHLEWRHRLKSGEIRDVEIYTGPLSYKGRTLIYSVLHDITERKQAEAAQRESEARFRNLFEHTPVAYLALDPSSHIVDVNNKFCELLGYAREEILGLNIKQICASESMQRIEKALTGASPDGQFAVQTDLFRKNRLPVPVVLSGKAQQAFSGNSARTHCILTDITEQKHIEAILREQKESLDAIFENAMDGMVLMNSDGDITGWNAQAAKIFGWNEDEIIGRKLHEILIPQRFREAHVRGMRQFLALGKNTILDERVEVFALRRNGEEFPLELSITPVKIGHEYEFSAFVRDITERRKREESLRLAATVFETIDEAIVITDKENRIVAVNPAFSSITGYELKEVEGKNPHILSSGKHSPEFYQELWATLTATGSWHGEVWNRRKYGDVYVEELSIHMVHDEHGRLTHHVGTFSDISARKAAEERVQHMAHYDLLTDLPNRALINDRIHQTLIKARRDRTRAALMFIDLDRFKPINDTLGHEVGDLLLQEVAQRLRDCVRESDTIARIGGDEFVVLLPEVEHERDAMTVADKILNALAQPFSLAGHQLHISSSIGISIYPDHCDEKNALIRNADIAMYYAKASGRNNAKVYHPGMQQNMQ